MTNPDPVSAAAHAAASSLAARYGPRLTADVATALTARQFHEPLGQYVDPVSAGSLIVSIATLVWMIYSDLRKQTPHPRADVIIRQVRAEYSEYDGPGRDDIIIISSIVISEIVQTTQRED
jgi:hypothetical protein